MPVSFVQHHATHSDSLQFTKPLRALWQKQFVTARCDLTFICFDLKSALWMCIHGPHKI